MQDKRVHARVPISVTVTCEARDGASFQGEAKDISLGGMYVESESPPAFGTELTVVGELPGVKGELRLPGVVRWSKAGGFWVQFGLLGARDTHAIARLMRPA